MAWCENPSCMKNGLRKADIEFCEESRKVLCHGCYSLMHPGWMPPAEYVDLTDSVPKVVRNTPEKPQVGFAIQITDGGGFRARVSYGGANIAFYAPTDEIKRLFGF